jgi:TPR repeat protein
MQAAGQGHAEAQNNLGALYANGAGVPVTFGAAIKHYTFGAAIKHHTQAADQRIHSVTRHAACLPLGILPHRYLWLTVI